MRVLLAIPVPHRPRSPMFLTPGLDASSSRAPNRDTKSADFQRRITLSNQPLKNPSRLAAVRRFGDTGPERDEFGLRRGLVGPELSQKTRADTGDFVGAEAPRRKFVAV